MPLIVYIPEKFRHLAAGISTRRGERSAGELCRSGPHTTELDRGEASHLDAWSGPSSGKYCSQEPKYLFGFRGRMDERYDFLRAVRSKRYLYIRNYMPHLPYGQYLAYMFETPTTRVWKALYDAGQLRPPQSNFWEPKPPEELYDVTADPHQIHNLADRPEYATVLAEMRAALRDHILTIRDVGFLPEPEMHRRAAGTTIYEMAQDPQRYPLERIYTMAEKAARLRPGGRPRAGGRACAIRTPASAIGPSWGLLFGEERLSCRRRRSFARSTGRRVALGPNCQRLGPGPVWSRRAAAAGSAMSAGSCPGGQKRCLHGDFCCVGHRHFRCQSCSDPSCS